MLQLISFLQFDLIEKFMKQSFFNERIEISTYNKACCKQVTNCKQPFEDEENANDNDAGYSKA